MRGKKILKTRELMSKLDFAALPRMPLSGRSKFPRIPCVYIAIKDSAVLYVGKTQNLYRRFPSHHRLKQLCDIGDVEIAWIDCSCDSYHLEKLEDAVTMHLQPTLNETTLLDMDVDRALKVLAAHGGFTVSYDGSQSIGILF